MPLTDKQQRFAEEYIVDLNATQAAIRSGYSAKTAEQQGPRLLGNVGVQEAVAALQAARSQRTGIEGDRVVEEMSRLALSDITDVMDWGEAIAVKGDDGEDRIVQGIVMKPLAEIPKSVRAAIAEVRQTRDGIVVKMHSKTAALDMLAKHLAVYSPERHEVTGKDGGPIETTDRDRARALAAFLARVKAEGGTAERK